jgi:hypothetical protein
MAEIAKLTSDERELLLGARLGSDYLENREFVAIRDVMAKALGIVDAQAARIEELELGQRHDKAELRRLTSGRFAPAERAVLDACAELLLIPGKSGRVRVPNQHEVELVGEAEWAKRQEHQLADHEDGLDYVTHPVHGGPVLRAELERGAKPARRLQERPGDGVTDVLAARLRELERTRNVLAREVLEWEILEDAQVPADLPDAVKALVAKYRGCPIEACDRCGAWAPLTPDPADPATSDEDRSFICAWGCDDAAKGP